MLNDQQTNENSGIFSQLDNNPGFKVAKKAPTIIKVVGVGGGGNNAVNHMYSQDISGISFVVINTDQQALENSPVPNHLLIGPETTKGLGAGNVPEVAKRAAEESEKEIAALFDDGTQMVFITAGMGGGTGTGAAPVVARIAREKGVLTIGIVTIPFLFEGNKKILKALQGADEMHKYVDALLIINNERLTEIYPDLDFINAFGKADDTLSIAARSISDLITVPGKINLDFRDVSTTLRDGGVAIISTGYGEGENRVTKAIEDALESPLLKNRDVYGSKKILMNFYFSPNSKNPFKMSEIDEMRKFMINFSNQVDVIYGVAFDDTLEDKVKITILAAGFNVSLENEAPANGAAAPRKPQDDDIKPSREQEMRIAEEYGESKVTRNEMDKAAARYHILRPEDIDNDDIIEKLEKSPAYKRDPKFKAEIAELAKAGRTAPAKPEQPKPAQGATGEAKQINFTD